MNSLLIKKFLPLLFVGTLLCSSCKKFLDVPPTSELESNYFENENRVQRGIGAIYASLSNIYGANLGSQVSQNGQTLYPLWLLQGDDLTTSGTNNAAYEAFSGFSPSDGRVAQLWQKYYFLIARANFMLEKLEIPEISAVIKTPNLKDYNRGEALFLRAYANYKLWDMFRKAPLQLSRIPSINESTLPPSKGFEMLDAAINDLKEAATLLPDSWNEQNKGRVFKNSAYGLLVKSYMLRANYALQYEGGNQTTDYANAIEAFNKIDNQSSIVGVPFGDNFDYKTENNTESLFEYQASHNQVSDNPWLDNDMGGPVGSFGAMYHYFDSHWGNYGSGGGAIGPSPKLIASFDPQDPRINETFKLAQDVDNVGGKLWWLGSAWDFFGGNQFVKYINGPRGDKYDVDFQIMSSNNPRIIRLADVKLAVAEAYLKTGDIANATKQVNDVRKRSRMSTPNGVESPVPADYGTVDMQKIMDERYFELAGEENIRWSDLRRWHAAGDINLANWTAADFGYPFDPSLFTFDVNRDLLFPIPTSEMNSNPLLMADGNNPGYN
ncbi:MAG TPA: RagB/SusD family nutrient uptake outer membrane protein [Flavitalea sp.]|nr:RagB/SusD family nutrient uptake outer membrane protein [Flavitalea sp.]